MSFGSRKLDLKASYSRWVAKAQADHGKVGLKRAIGGEFEAFGTVQVEMLKHYGLRPGSYLIDVGCGSGRTAMGLRDFLVGPYLGLDIVPELLAHARKTIKRPDWQFRAVDSQVIPEKPDCADMVCFFSVLTHLLHEQSYLYLEEARRVLRPGGVVVFSFLEFAMDFQWNVFQATVNEARAGGVHPLNVFIERTAIHAWARRLGMSVVDIRNGDDAFVPLPHPVTLDDSRVMESFGNLGQSICVLSR